MKENKETYIARSAFKCDDINKFDATIFLAVRKIKEIIKEKGKDKFYVYIDIVEPDKEE